MQAAGGDGVITGTSIKVNGVGILTAPDKTRFGDGTSNFEGDAFFFVEAVKLFFLTPQYPNAFSCQAIRLGQTANSTLER